MSARPADDGAGLLARFERGEIALERFSHRDHVRIAHDLLARASFTEAAHLFASGLKRLADAQGHAGRYHETITVAFLALIGERMAADRPAGFAGFAARNPDLFAAAMLESRYSAARLRSAAARATFLLPDLPCR